MWIFLLVALLAAAGLFYAGRTWLGWVAPGALLFVGWWRSGVDQAFLFLFTAGLFALAALIGGFAPLRRDLVSRRLMKLLAPILPRMSDTERIAIEAGTVWWEAEFFTGRAGLEPTVPVPVPAELTEKRAGVPATVPVEELCAMVRTTTAGHATTATSRPRRPGSFIKAEQASWA